MKSDTLQLPKAQILLVATVLIVLPIILTYNAPIRASTDRAGTCSCFQKADDKEDVLIGHNEELSPYASVMLSAEDAEVPEGHNLDLHVTFKNLVDRDVFDLIPPQYRSRSLTTYITRLPEDWKEGPEAELPFTIHGGDIVPLPEHIQYDGSRWKLSAKDEAKFAIPLFDDSTRNSPEWLEPGRYALHVVYFSCPHPNIAFTGMSLLDWSPVVSNGIVLTVLSVPPAEQEALKLGKAFLTSEAGAPEILLAKSEALVLSGLPAYLEKRVRWRSAVLGSVRKPMLPHSQISLDEGQPDHASEVLGGLLEPAEHPAALLEPADQPLDYVAVAIGLTVERHRPVAAVLVGLARDHRRDVQVQQVLVDPIGAIALVPGQRHRPSDRSAPRVEQAGVRTDHHGIERRAFVCLPGGQLEVQRVTGRITQHVDFAGQTAAAAAQRVVRRLVRVPFFPPPEAHLWARTVVPSMHHNSSSSSTSPCRRWRIAMSVPSWFQVSNRSHAVPHGPNRSGRSRHAMPVLSTQRMPSSTSRRSRGGRPVRLRGGNRSAIRDHCSSMSRCRSMTSPYEESVPLHHRFNAAFSDRA